MPRGGGVSVYYAYLVSHFPPEVNQRGLTDLGYYDETCYYETPGGGATCI